MKRDVKAAAGMLKVAVVVVLPLAVALHPGSGRAGWRTFKKRDAPLFASSFDTDSAVADVKARLMQLVEPLDRGFGASEDAKRSGRPSPPPSAYRCFRDGGGWSSAMRRTS